MKIKLQLDYSTTHRPLFYIHQKGQVRSIEIKVRKCTLNRMNNPNGLYYIEGYIISSVCKIEFNYLF